MKESSITERFGSNNCRVPNRWKTYRRVGATNLAPRPADGYFRQHAPIVLCGMPAEARIRRDQAYPIFHALNGWIVSAQKVNGLYHHFSEAEADGNKYKNDGAGGEDGSRSIG